MTTTQRKGEIKKMVTLAYNQVMWHVDEFLAQVQRGMQMKESDAFFVTACEKLVFERDNQVAVVKVQLGVDDLPGDENVECEDRDGMWMAGSYMRQLVEEIDFVGDLSRFGGRRTMDDEATLKFITETTKVDLECLKEEFESDLMNAK